MEIVEIALSSQHQRAALPIAADLSAGQRAIGIVFAASACGDYARIGAQQVSAGPHRRRAVRSAGAAAEIESDVTTGPLISGACGALIAKSAARTAVEPKASAAAAAKMWAANIDRAANGDVLVSGIDMGSPVSMSDVCASTRRIAVALASAPGAAS